jgi:hypothetical protein
MASNMSHPSIIIYPEIPVRINAKKIIIGKISFLGINLLNHATFFRYYKGVISFEGKSGAPKNLLKFRARILGRSTFQTERN